MRRHGLIIVLALAVLATAVTFEMLVDRPADSHRDNIVVARASAQAVDRNERALGEPKPGCEDASSIATANTAFGFRLFRTAEHRREPGTNLLLSPLSAQLALQLLANGADDHVWEDVLLSMCLQGRSVREVNAANRELRRALRDSGSGVEFTDANSIWTNERYTPSPQLRRAAKQYYDGVFDTFSVPRAQQSADRINGWIGRATKGRINHAIMAADIDPPDTEMAMFLVSALTFDGRWATVFEPADTYDARFRLEGGGTTDVRMMTQTSRLAFGASDGYVGARIPYGEAGRFAMHVLVPRGESTPDDILAGLDARSWHRWTEAYEETDVTVSIPRMKIGTTQELLAPLGELGLPARSYNSLLAERDLPPVQLEFVRQKTFMEVDEQGTKAAAATVVGASLGAGFDSGPAVVADRPYVLVLDDRTTGAVLFAGVVADPTTAPS
jgi:serpin B